MKLIRFFKTLKNKLNKFSSKNIIFIFIFFNVIIRIPSLKNDLFPYFFVCDEGIYFGETYHMLVDQNYIQKSFRAGFANVYTVLIPFKIFTLIFTEGYINPDQLILFGRFLLPILLSSLSILFIDLAIREIYTKATVIERTIYLSIFSLSGYFFSQSRIWYPDHYQIFFSSIVIYLILKIYRQKKLSMDLYFLIIAFIFLVGVKYSGLLLLATTFPCLAYVFFNSLEFKNSLNRFYLVSKYILFAFFFFSLLNFSIFLNFEKFLYDFNANFINYGQSSLDLEGFLYYFVFLFLVPFSIFSAPFLIIAIIKLINDESWFLAYLFIGVPLILSLYFGSYGTLVNRNINFLIPFVLLLLTVGISSNLKFIKQRFSNILIILILSFQIWSFSITLLDDFKIDSRIQAEAWIMENLNNLNFTEVGNNEFCTGDSPIKSFAETTYDHNFELGFDYYLINDYWDSKATRTLKRRNILFTTNHKNDQFYYFNYRDLLNNRLFKIEQNFNSIEGYKVFKTFEGNGPTMILYKKSSTNLP